MRSGKNSGGRGSRREFLQAGAGIGAAAVTVPLLPERAFAAPGTAGAAEARQVEQWNTDARRRILIKNGCVLTMDPAIGDFVQGDVLIEGDKIVKVAPDIDATAHVVDARGTIVLPGLVDTHRHCWENYFRRAIPNADALNYVNFTHYGFARFTRPQDDYAGALVSGLGSINAGTTCILDYHNSRTPQHTDATINAHRDSGVRAVLGYCKSGDGSPHWPQDIRRVQKQFFSSTDQLLTLSLATVEFVKQHYDLAREIGVRIIHDGAIEGEAGVEGASFTQQLENWSRAGLLGPDVTFIHGTGMSEKGFGILKQNGSLLALAATSDAQLRGLGDSIPPIQKALDAGLLPGLSTDVEVCLSPDMFSQMKAVFLFQRMLANKRWADGDPKAPSPMIVQQVLQMATMAGAACNGLADRIGSLTPGKQADIVMLEADDIMNMPLNNAYGTAVIGADVSSVRNVIIAGRVRKWNHKLVGVDLEGVRRVVHESRDYLAEASKTWSPKDIIGNGPFYGSTAHSTKPTEK